MTIRSAVPKDAPALLELAVDTGLFQPDQVEMLQGLVSEYFEGDAAGHQNWIVDDANDVVGAAYYAREIMTDRTWNIYFVGVRPAQQGSGRGSALLRHVERDLGDRGERLLIVETSGVADFERTRAFYRKNGYDEEARLRDFYGAGDDKIVFRKVLTRA